MRYFSSQFYAYFMSWGMSENTSPRSKAYQNSLGVLLTLKNYPSTCLRRDRTLLASRLCLNFIMMYARAASTVPFSNLFLTALCGLFVQ